MANYSEKPLGKSLFSDIAMLIYTAFIHVLSVQKIAVLLLHSPLNSFSNPSLLSSAAELEFFPLGQATSSVMK